MWGEGTLLLNLAQLHPERETFPFHEQEPKPDAAFFFLLRFNIFAIFAYFLFILVAASSPFTFESRPAVRAEMGLVSQGS